MAAEHSVVITGQAPASAAGGEEEDKEEKNKKNNIKERVKMFVPTEMIRRISFQFVGGGGCCFSKGGDCSSKSSSEDPRRSGR